MSKFLAFAIPYIGRWPRWMRLFLRSCARNPHVDFLLMSPDAPQWALPPNVIHHAMSVAQMKERIEGAMDLRLPTLEGRKLPDVRTFLGLATADLFREYEFFGYCDIDLAFGDLSWSLTSELLSDCDVYSPHDRYVAGHCAVFRNTEEVRQLCRSIPDYRKRALIPVTTHMDETGITKVLQERPDIRYRHPTSIPDEMTKPRAPVGVTAMSSLVLWGLGSNPGYRFEWNDGRGVLDLANGTTAEIMYFHFMSLKRPSFWLRYKDRDYDRFTFTGLGFNMGGFGGGGLRRLTVGMSCQAIDLTRRIYRRYHPKPAEQRSHDHIASPQNPPRSPASTESTRK